MLQGSTMSRRPSSVLRKLSKGLLFVEYILFFFGQMALNGIQFREDLKMAFAIQGLLYIEDCRKIFCLWKIFKSSSV